jgi:hypothetical protein
VPIVLSKEVEVEHEEALPPLKRAVRVEYESAWLIARVAGVVNVTLLYKCSTVSSIAVAMLCGAVEQLLQSSLSKQWSNCCRELTVRSAAVAMLLFYSKLVIFMYECV